MRWAGYLVRARGLIGAGEEREDALVRVSGTCFRRNVAAAVQAFGVDEVGEDVRRPLEDRPGGEEHDVLGGEHGHGALETFELFFGCRPGQARVQPHVTVDLPELPDGEVFGLRQYGLRRAQEALSRGSEAVEEYGEGHLVEHP